MTKTLKIIPRHQLNATAWDACVAASPQRILYGYSWYLDAVLLSPDWKWVGLVSIDEAGRYRAVMPVPLRRKRVAGIVSQWVVHQPFFCQFLDVFSLDESVDSTPFFQLMIETFRYGSVYCTRQQFDKQPNSTSIRKLTTHTLNLSSGYSAIYQNYSPNRKANHRRAQREFRDNPNWEMLDSIDPEPLITLFRENHAGTIDGSVADWAYDMFSMLLRELTKRGLATLRYALHNGQIEAGALFVQEGNRIIYLFNAASEIGRKANVRTLLIDQLIQEKAGETFVLDFESPTKSSIRDFYQSFGAIEEPFWTMRWNRLTALERGLLRLKKRF
ncbi:GNAT family N-acetyltransferase [Spirosoma foliorum]|uniref:GNAT family N-acetyltransferase n=1 Tax=Spirosoma foliorum TaxID=2710596 RepID=A0A7G5GR28_9BACT|nr:GNAT family N-acetyltransferase [Spirosoma foliorum]QMW01320.1 GNAT family N-acetyltransferase [Spirosoma foliorum]